MVSNQQSRSTPLLTLNPLSKSSTPVLSKAVSAWLLDKGSTTAKFQQQCRHLQIDCCFEGYPPKGSLPEEEISDLAEMDQPLWLREVLMIADSVPWLYGRSLIPQSLLEHPDLSLTTLGNTPLGARLFTLPEPPQREIMQIAQVSPPVALALLANQTAESNWWARRSRLTLPQGALLLTELFLPASPLYQHHDE